MSERPASVAAARIVQEALKPDVSVSELAELAQADPAMALRVVALVNSPAFQMSQPVTDVRRAAALLGLRGLRNVALSLMITDMIPPSESGRVLLTNALRRAMACRAIADRLRVRERDTYFTAGLFLEAGYFVTAREHLEETATIARAPAAHRIVRERAQEWEPHPQMGARLAASYGLAEETVEAIERHHDEMPPKQPLARAAWLAERLAAVFESGERDSLVNRAIESGAQIGIDRANIEAMMTELPQSVRQAAESMECEIADQREFEELMDDAHNGLIELNQQYEQLVRTLEGVISDKDELTERLRHANESLQRLATTDALTQMPNKRGLEDFLVRTMSRAEREGTPLSLLMIDVDHFKNFNDTWGHAMGDEVLRVVGRALLDCARMGDMAARHGGEEFTVVLPTADESGAMIVAERVRSAIESAKVAGPEGTLSVTASIGVATVYGVGPSGQGELFERADRALYDSKDGGRNRVTAAQAAQPKSACA